MNNLNTQQLSMPSGDDSGVIKFGLSVLFVVFVLFGGWMAYAPLQSSSVAVGEVSADIDKKQVQHLNGGTIDKIFVKEGDFVKKGDLLIKLEEIQVKSELEALRIQYMDSVATYSRLIALRDNKKSIIFPSEVTDENMIKDQENIFFSTVKSQNDQREISQKRISQLENQIEGLKTLIDTKEARKISLNEELKEWNVLFEQKLVDKIRIREIQRELDSITGDIQSNQSDILRLNEQIIEVQTQQQFNEEEYKNQVLDQILKVKNNISDLSAKIDSLNDVLSKTEIKAPISGNVVGLNIHTEGAIIKPGSDILQIIPEDSDLIVIAQVKITDIDKVKIGLLSDIRFSAFNMQQAHVIEGKVIHVSADRFTDENTGEPYYEAKIKVTKKGKEQLKDYDFRLLAGMPAEVMINLGDRTPLSYLIKPFTDMISRGFNEE